VTGPTLCGGVATRLWLIRPNDDSKPPWTPYPETSNFGYVVRATSEVAARAMAAGRACDEGRKALLSAELSTCVELTADGAEGIIMTEFSGA